MLSIEAWKQWEATIEAMPSDDVDACIVTTEHDPVIPFVEKQLRLGHLYLKKDCIATAASLFQNIDNRLILEQGNTAFLEENAAGIHIYRAVIICLHGEPLGGVEECCGQAAGPALCCCGSMVACVGVSWVANIIGGEAASDAVIQNCWSAPLEGCGNCAEDCCNGEGCFNCCDSACDSCCNTCC